MTRARTAAGATRTAAPDDVPAWLRTASLGLAVVTVLASAYLTVEHFTAGSSFACPEGEVVNCRKVTSSEYGTFLGMPVAVLGLLWSLVVLALCLPRSWRDRRLEGPRIGLLAVGTAMVLYLVWAELFGIGAICLWCTVVHVATVALLGLALTAWALRPRT